MLTDEAAALLARPRFPDAPALFARGIAGALARAA